MRHRAPWIAGGLVVLAALAAVGVLAFGRHDKAAATAPRTATAQTGEVAVTVSAAGTVTAVTARTLSFGTSGTVSSLKVSAGDTVAKGAVLAKLDTDDATAAVDAAQDNVDSAEDALDTAQTAADAAEAAAVAAAKAAAATTSSTTRSGTGSGSASGAPGGGTRSTVGTSAGGTGSGGSGSGGSNAGGSSRSAADAVFSAQQRLNNAKLTLANAERALSGATITAPIAGKILSVSGAVGSELSSGSAFITLAGKGDVAVTASFSEAAVAKLKVGQAATITLADHNGGTLTGKVSQVDPVGTVSSRLVTYGAQVTFDAAPGDLLVGQSADVTVTTASAKDAVTVPSGAVSGINGTNGSVTIRDPATGGTQIRTVEVGLRGDQATQITAGLQAGDVVVLPGA